jgi:carbonic anhydrase
VDSIEKNEHLPGNLGAIVDAIRPAYEEAHGKGGDIVDQTVRRQILRTVAALEGDAVLAGHVRDKSLGIAGVYYNLDTGQVSVLKTAGFIPS